MSFLACLACRAAVWHGVEQYTRLVGFRKVLPHCGHVYRPGLLCLPAHVLEQKKLICPFLIFFSWSPRGMVNTLWHSRQVRCTGGRGEFLVRGLCIGIDVPADRALVEQSPEQYAPIWPRRFRSLARREAVRVNGVLHTGHVSVTCPRDRSAFEQAREQ